MYPFSSSPLNYILLFLGTYNLLSIQEYTDEAYIVTMLGFTGVYVGKFCYDKFRPIVKMEYIVRPFYLFFGRLFEKLAKRLNVVRIFSVCYIFVLIGFVYFTATSGLIRNPREYFKLNTQLAPIYTLILSTFDFVFLLLSAIVLQYNNKIDKILLLTLAVFGFFFRS